MAVSAEDAPVRDRPDECRAGKPVGPSTNQFSMTTVRASDVATRTIRTSTLPRMVAPVDLIPADVEARPEPPRQDTQGAPTPANTKHEPPTTPPQTPPTPTHAEHQPEPPADVGAGCSETLFDVGELSDDELIDAMITARRQASSAQAAELAAVAELARRRRTEAAEPARVEAISPEDYLVDEIAAALTLTARSAGDLVDFATALSQRLPATLTALGSGDIDYCKARTLWHGTALLDESLTAHVEAVTLTKAGEQTTGEIRAKIRRLIKKLDPGAFDRRRETAEKQRRVALTDDEVGTAHLSGCDLPAAAATSAYNRINAIAAAIRADGDTRGIDQLRADVFLGLLHGGHDLPEPSAATTTEQNTPVEHAWTHLDDLTADFIARTIREQLNTLTDVGPGHHTGRPWLPDFPGSPDAADPPDLRDASDLPSLPSAPDLPSPPGAPDLPGAPDRPGLLRSPGSLDLPGLPDRHRDLPALLARAAERISAALTDLKAPWCAIGRPTADGPCGHQTTGYRPPAALQRLIRHRDTRCRYPGCRRPAHRADIDHTTPYDHAGPTCICNLSVLCRRHHKLKQAKHWKLIQFWPGVLLWITPTGHWRIVTPTDRE